MPAYAPGLYPAGSPMQVAVRRQSGPPSLPYDPVVIFLGDSQVLTQGDTAAADAYSPTYAADPKVKVADATLTGAFVQYAPGVSATPATGRTGLNYTSNKNNPGPEIGFIPPFRAANPANTLYLINLAAPGSYQGRGQTKGTCTGYVSSGTGSSTAGNVFTLTSGAMPDAGTLITGTGIPAGTVLASFGPGGNTRYVFKVGVSGFGLSFAAGTPGAPITVTKFGYSYSTTEGTLYQGSDASITNGYKTRVLNALAKMMADGLTARVVAVVILLGTNDMADTAAAGFFSDDETAFIAAIKAAWPLTSAKIILVRAKSGAVASATVRAAQQSIADADAQVYLLDADTFTLSDGTHFTVAGRSGIGAAAYDILAGAAGI